MNNSHRAAKFTFASCESYLLSNPPIIRNRILFSNEINRLDYNVKRIAAALNDNNFIYAIQNKVIIADLELNIRNIIEKSLLPVSLSLDEADKIYIIVQAEDNFYHLWILTTEGQLLFDRKLPEISSIIEIPPIISYEHKVFLAFPDRLLSFSKSGELMWDTFTAGIIGGAIITENEFLIVAEGNLLTAFNRSGKRKLIYNFKDETLTTPPVLTINKEIFVATRDYIYCLVPQT